MMRGVRSHDRIYERAQRYVISRRPESPERRVIDAWFSRGPREFPGSRVGDVRVLRNRSALVARGPIFDCKERKAMRGKTIGCVMGSLGLLLGAGAAWGNQQMDTTGSGSDTSSAQSSSGSEASTQVAGKPECRDAGVTIAFTTGSAELDQNARGALDGVATWMKADENRTMHLEGFADTTGNSEANLVLSAHRAEAVKSYLIDHGVASSKVMTVGRGEEIDHLPANGRAVTFMAGQPPKAAPAVAETEPAPTPPPPPPVEETPPVAPVTTLPPPAA